MATRAIHRLKAIQIKNAPPGSKLCDGGGLWVYVSPTGARNWVLRYRLNGADREMGLGPIRDVPLATARTLAAHYRALKRDGIDPITHQQKKRQQARLDATGAITFRDCVDAYLAAHESAWQNAKHAQQWRNTLDQYASAEFGELPVREIDTGMILRALEKIWYDKPETGSRVRQRIESVLDWATVRGYRAGENPARWRGHLDKLLPKHTKLKKVAHHAALPWRKMGAFMAALRQQEGFAARALELTILCATRTGETLGVSWDEIDLQARTWTVAAERMKARREHRIPLSDQAVRLLEALPRADTFVFPGQRYGRQAAQQHGDACGPAPHGA
jgi:integrase